MGRQVVGGAVLWLLRPAYIVVEVVVAARTTGGYSLVHDTVSRLGTSGCSAAFCSPSHALMNATFVAAGLLLAAGAVLLAPRLGPLVAALLVVAGLSSVATGLAPLDADPLRHAVAAAPLFVCQPLALVLLARRSRRVHRRTARWLLLTGAVTAAAGLAFVVGAPAAGLLERLALWPPLLAFATVAAMAAGHRDGQAQSWPSRRSSASSSVPS